jgi:hypothetical protein
MLGSIVGLDQKGRRMFDRVREREVDRRRVDLPDGS